MTEHEKFQYGKLAGKLLSENPNYARGSLDVLAGDLGISDAAKGFIEGAYASEKGLEVAAKVYSKSFDDEFGKLKTSEAYSWYEPTLEGVDASEKDKLKNAFTKEDLDLNSVQKEYQKAAFTLQAPEGMFDDKAKNAAKDTFKKYQEIMALKESFDQYKFEALRDRAVKAAGKREFKDLASRL
jgi:hypothetical protein